MKNAMESHQPPFRIWLCGTFHVERRVGESYQTVPSTAWGGSSYPRLLVKALLCRPARRARREALLEMLWPELELEQATTYLNAATTRLRGALRPTKEQESLLITENDFNVYRLHGQEQVWTDVDAALALLTEAEQLGRTTLGALPLLEQATNYFNRGPLLEEEESLWIASRRATINRARSRCRLWLAEAYEQHNRPGQAEAVLCTLLEEDATDEDSICRLMALLAQQARTHQAIRLYEQTCELFAREGLELTASIRTIAERVRTEPTISSHFSPRDEYSNVTAEEKMSIGQRLPLETIIPPTSMRFTSERLFLHTFIGSIKDNTTYTGRNSMQQNRRQMLHSLLMIGSTALMLSPSAVFSLAGGEQLNLSVLEGLEMITASYWRLCTNTSLDLLGNVSEHFYTVVHHLQRALPQKTAQRLCSLSGEMAQILGKTLFDIHEYSLAWSYYMFSLKAAQVASNQHLWATGIGRMMLLLLSWNAPEKALPLLQEVHQLNIQSKRILCWLAVVEAEVHAHLGDSLACDTALKMAKELSEQEPLGADRYATGFSASRLAGYEGACFVRLRQPDRALPALQQALSLLDPQALRRQSTLLTDMGIAYAQQGNIQKASQLANQALTITTQTKSRAVLERVRSIHQELKAWKETTIVYDLEKQLDATLALITA